MATKETIFINNEPVNYYSSPVENFSQTIKVKPCRGWVDHFGKAVDANEKVLRQARRDERHPDKRILSITERLIIEGIERKNANKNKKEKEPIRFARNSREFLDSVIQK